MKIVKKKSTENCHFYSHEKSLYIAWACFRNDLFTISVDGQYWRYTGFRLDAGYPRRLRGWYIGVQAALYDYGWIILLKVWFELGFHGPVT